MVEIVAKSITHFIDLFQWLFGMPKKVFQKLANAKINKKVEDTAHCFLSIMKKTNWRTIEATNAIRPKNLERSLSIIGEKGSVIVGGMTGKN